MTEAIGGNAAEQLRSYIEKIERLEADRKEVSIDISEMYKAAKGSGFDVKTMRKIVQLRRMDPDARQEAEALLDVYRQALSI